MSILELNLRAKKTITVPPPEAPKTNNGKLQLEEGKKYILNCGAVVGPLKQPNKQHLLGKCLVTTEGEWEVAKLSKPKPYEGYYWDIDDGVFTGSNQGYPNSIRREWTPTWKEEEEWMNGQAFEYQTGGNWYSLGHSYEIVCDAFGKDSKTTNRWWATYFAPVFATKQVRKV